MNRDERLGKLSRAVRDWRGVTHPSSGAWLVRPLPRAVVRVRRWLEELGLNVDESVAKIEAMKSYPEFHAWIRSL
jgi:hypothetical protein